MNRKKFCFLFIFILGIILGFGICLPLKKQAKVLSDSTTLPIDSAYGLQIKRFNTKGALASVIKAERCEQKQNNPQLFFDNPETQLPEKKLTITSEKALFNKIERTMVYLNDVKLKTPEKTLYAQQLTLYQDNSGQFKLAVALGNPAHFIIINAQKNETIKGEAKEIQYDTNTQNLTLMHQASLSTPTQKLASEKIVYNLTTEKLVSDPGKQQRTTFTFNHIVQKNHE